MKQTNLLFTAMLLLAIVFISCKKGDTGPAGPQGVQGMQGVAGPIGPAGKDGSIIYAGIVAPPATLGDAGDYYLQTTTGAFFGPKLASGWGSSFSLVGPAGATGMMGATGNTGATGSTGGTGATGATGATGNTGAAGVTGNTGANGINGSNGINGANGSQVIPGTVDPTNAIGNMGDYYLNKTTFVLFGPKTAAGWGLGLELKGKDGNANIRSYTTVENDNLHWSGAWLYTVPAITQDIIDNGAVLGFLTFVGSPGLAERHHPLPYIRIPNAAPYYTYTMALDQINTGIALIRTSTTDPSIPVIALAKFRIVVIQGTTLAQMSAKNPNINFKDYSQVSKLLKL